MWVRCDQAPWWQQTAILRQYKATADQHKAGLKSQALLTCVCWAVFYSVSLKTTQKDWEYFRLSGNFDEHWQSQTCRVSIMIASLLWILHKCPSCHDGNPRMAHQMFSMYVNRLWWITPQFVSHLLPCLYFCFIYKKCVGLCMTLLIWQLQRWLPSSTNWANVCKLKVHLLEPVTATSHLQRCQFIMQ